MARNKASRLTYSLVLCLSLVLFPSTNALTHGSSPLGGQKKQRSTQQCEECSRLDRLNALDPSQQIESDGGFSEFWDHNEDQLQCAGVSAARHTIQPQGLFLPSYSNAARLIFVLEGEGIGGVVIPGCSESFSSFEQGGYSQQGQGQGQQFGGQGQQSRFQGDQHQKVHNLRKGDVVTLPAGVAAWAYNEADRPLILVILADFGNAQNQLDRNVRRFFLAGNTQQLTQIQGSGSSQAGGAGGSGQLGGGNVLAGFDIDLLSQSLGIDQETAQKIKSSSQQQNGFIIRVERGLQIARPTMRESQEWWQTQSQQGGQGGLFQHGSGGQTWRGQGPYPGSQGTGGQGGYGPYPGGSHQGTGGQSQGGYFPYPGGHGTGGQSTRPQPHYGSGSGSYPYPGGSHQGQGTGSQNQGYGPYPGGQGTGSQSQSYPGQQGQGGSQHWQGTGGQGQKSYPGQQGQQSYPGQQGSGGQTWGGQGSKSHQGGQQIWGGSGSGTYPSGSHQGQGSGGQQSWGWGSSGQHQGSGQQGSTSWKSSSSGPYQGSGGQQGGTSGPYQGSGQQRGSSGGQQGGSSWKWSSCGSGPWGSSQQGQQGQGQTCSCRPNDNDCRCNLIAAANGIEESICSMKFKTNIGDPRKADLYSREGGHWTTLNSYKLPILSYLQLTMEKGQLRQNAMTAPHWNVNAHAVVYVTRGAARFQVVDHNGRTVMDDVVRQGQLLVVPQNFAVANQAQEDNFEWIALKTNENAIINQITGKGSAINALPDDLLANAYGLSSHEVKMLKQNRAKECLILPPLQQAQLGSRTFQ